MVTGKCAKMGLGKSGYDVRSRRVDVMMIGSELSPVVLISMVLEVAKMALVFYFYFFLSSVSRVVTDLQNKVAGLLWFIG